jgi:hypothetical protein
VKSHEAEITSILEQVKPWPMEDRVALAYQILRDMRKKTRDSAPRDTAREAHGIARADGPAPDDATVKRWLDEHRTRKYG